MVAERDLKPVIMVFDMIRQFYAMSWKQFGLHSEFHIILVQWVWMNAYVHTYMHTCMHAYILIGIHIYTYIQEKIQTLQNVPASSKSKVKAKEEHFERRNCMQKKISSKERFLMRIYEE